MTTRHEDPIVVSSVGAVSPVGHSAAVSFASVRSRLARIGESPELKIRDDKGRLVDVTCAAVTGITDGHRRYLRHFRMAVRAFAEVMTTVGLEPPALERTTVHLAVAEPARPGMDHRVEQDLLRRIVEVLGLDPPLHATVSATGHAAAFDAVTEAVAALESGRSARAIVGGVDGYLDELTLQWLRDTGRLKSEENSKGFVPGEAAAFMVLERHSSVAAREGRAFATLESMATAVEPNSVYDKAPSTASGLTSAIRTAIDRAATPVSLVVCDLNGERYRANEWGLTMVRAFGAAAPPRFLWHPADCLGDCGAAAGILNIVFASMALQRGVPDGSVLVWGSSDDGQRGAAILSAPNQARSH